MTTNRPLRVFLCHSSADKPAVRELYQKLRAEPWIDPWLDEKKLLGGQNWRKEIPKAVRSSDAVIVCLSNSSVNKEGYVQAEIKFSLDVALEKPENIIFIIPARLENCEVPNSLGDLHWVNLFESEGYSLLISSLKVRAKSLDIKIDGSVLKKTTKDKKPKKPITPIELKPKSTVNKPVVRIEEKIDPLENKAAIEAQKNEFLPHPTQKWIEANKITLSNGMEFMCVPAGKFLMGSNDGDDSEKPQHIVDIPYDYWMARFPVTNELYNAYSNFKNITHPVSKWEKKKEHPVTSIAFSMAVIYCQWLNEILKDEIPSGLVLRLPTEAEWEKTACGAAGRKYPWGNVFNENRCNVSSPFLFPGIYKSGTTSVKQYSPLGDSPYGCADMAGNVWEWTHSLFKPYPYHATDGRENETFTIARVLRGGSFGVSKDAARCASRSVGSLSSYPNYVGFRVCLAPPLSK
jgi:formylglycine-generating enzyme required for sulfatase activity